MSPKVRAFVIFSLLTAALASCGATDGDQHLSGKELYLRYGCSSCHGGSGGGGSLGPPLRGAAQHWQASSLTDFLVDPAEALKSDPRLAELDAAFRTDMRPFSELTRDQLSRIAQFVLSLK